MTVGINLQFAFAADQVDALQAWISYYNGSYLHSALGYKPPNKFEEEYRNSQLTLLITP